MLLSNILNSVFKKTFPGIVAVQINLLEKYVSVFSFMKCGIVSSIHVMAQIVKSGDLSNLIRSFDSISGGFLSNYFNAR